MKKKNVLSWLVPVAVLLTVAINALANIIPFNGQTTGDISNSIKILFVPANYVFTIWSLIYAWLAVFAVYQFVAKKLPQNIDDIRKWFLLTCVANSLWIVLWHYEQFLLSVITMLILLGSLIMIYAGLLKSGKQKVSASWYWCVEAAFGLYLGWITVATIANIATALVVNEWGQWGIAAETWTVILLLIATLIGVTFAYCNRDAIYGLVLVWAFVGIWIKFQDLPIVGNTALIMAAVMAVASVVGGVRRFQLQRTE